jgi:Xaa-Pro aminopeptidase
VSETKADERRAALEAAEARALKLFDLIEAAGIVRAGRTEKEAAEDIRALAERELGVTQHWHRQIVRSGPNTLTTASDYPDDRTIEPDDNVYVDLGPVFEAWEADIGKTYALSADPERQRLAADLPRVFDQVQAHYRASPDVTGAELYAYAHQAANAAGWDFGGAIAGHWVGEFPHNTWPGERPGKAIWPANDAPLRGLDHEGRARHWILEIHLVDKARTFGGFYERLL